MRGAHSAVHYLSTQALWAALLWSAVAVRVVIEFANAAREPSGDEIVTTANQRRLAGTYVISSFAGAWVAFRLRSLAIPGPGRVDIVAGVVLLWAGIGLRQWAVHTLGRFFTFTLTVRRDQPVVAAGPYRVLRHPSYSGLLLANLGFGIALGNWLALAVLTIPYCVSLVRRIEVEEAMLRQGLGPAYDDFAKSRKRLVPGVW